MTKNELIQSQIDNTVAIRWQGKSITVKTLRDLFEGVQNPVHWKNPIKAVVAANLVDLIEAAIVWFHAGTVRKSAVDAEGFVTLTNDGYAA